MPFLPDTNVWIYLLKNPGGPLDAQVRSRATADIFLCSVVKAELWHGAEKYGNRERRLRALDLLFAPFVSLPFDDEAARHYADIRHQLELKGAIIGPNDLKIAAIARAHGLTLVSAGHEFSRVPGLQVEDWTRA
jgi:tRNA(fMet)-specific endonuclease VapC